LGAAKVKKNILDPHQNESRFKKAAMFPFSFLYSQTKGNKRKKEKRIHKMSSVRHHSIFLL